MGTTVSIVIPLYNGASFIMETIESCLNQSHSEVEIIVIDDASRDDGFSIVEDMTKNCTQLRLFRNTENQGIIKTVNRGIALSDGDYILALGHDDVLPKYHIERMLNEFSDTTALVFCSSHWIDGQGNIIKEHCGTRDVEVDLFALSTGNKINSCGLIMRKALLQKVGCFTESVHFRNYGEWDLWIKLGSVGDIKYSSENISYYRRHNTNITNTFDDITTRRELHAYYKHCRKLAYRLGDFSVPQKVVFWLSYVKYLVHHHTKNARIVLTTKTKMEERRG